MNEFKFETVLCIMFVCLIEASCTLFDFQPGKLDYERSKISRAWPVGKTYNPITELHHMLDFQALVSQYGYPAEEHLITTVDGYKLRLHRMPGSPSNPKSKGKPVVYFQHGIFLSSDSWILRGPNKDLAYMLADAGFDVWFGNVRGNTYSRAHVSLSPDYDPEFWNFSYHEMALYDVSRIIDYILMETGQKKLIYIGHSMGATMSYVLLSMRPEYNQRIEYMISLAPVAFWQGQPSPFIQFLSRQANLIKKFVISARMFEIFPRTNGILQIIRMSCNAQSIFQPFCTNLISFVLGGNPKEANMTMVPYYYSYFFSGCSRKTLLHYEQNLKSGDFRMYNYGPRQNLITYNSEVPPLYNLKNIVTPVAIFYGKGDALISDQDPLNLAKRLPNVMTIEAVPDEQFTHIDFLFANHLKTLLLDRLMQIIKTMTREDNFI